MLTAARLFFGCCLLGLAPASAEETTVDTNELAAIDKTAEETIKRWLPRTHQKMKHANRRETVELQAVVLGDDNCLPSLSDGRGGTATQTWHQLFLNRLAGRYFFSGGVRLAEGGQNKPRAVKHPPMDESETGPQTAPSLIAGTRGPAIVLRNLARRGAVSLQAYEALSSNAFDYAPDIMLVMYGLGDTAQAGSLQSYRNSLTEIVNQCKANSVDVVIVAPPLHMRKDWRLSLGLSRPYASVAREVAEKANVLFVDAGAAQCALDEEMDFATDALMPDQMLRHLRQQFERQGTEDSPFLSAKGHVIVADGAWEALSQAPTPPSMAITASLTLPPKPQSEARVKLNVTWPKSDSGEKTPQPLSVSVLSMDRIWVPKTAAFDPEAKGRSAEFSIPCQPVLPTGPQMFGRGDLTSGEEFFVRGSALLSRGGHVRLINFTAPILPLAVAFPPGRFSGLTDKLTLPVRIANGLPAPYQGQAEILWRGETQKVNLSVEAGQSRTLPISLNLPRDTDGRATKSQLTVRLTNGNETYEFHREIELAQDQILDRRAELVNRSTHLANAIPAPKGTDSTSVGLTCKADGTGLYLIYDLPPIQGNPVKDQPSANLQVILDARAPGQLGGAGFCGQIILSVPWQDGRFSVDRLQPAVFGNGYDRTLNHQYFLASVTTQRDNRRQVRLSIPRAYFYLHEWSIGESGQNSVGLNTHVSLIKITPQTPNGTFPLETTYSLVSPGMSRYDPLGLGGLQFHRSTAGWSARVY